MTHKISWILSLIFLVGSTALGSGNGVERGHGPRDPGDLKVAWTGPALHEVRSLSHSLAIRDELLDQVTKAVHHELVEKGSGFVTILDARRVEPKVCAGVQCGVILKVIIRDHMRDHQYVVVQRAEKPVDNRNRLAGVKLVRIGR